ncbi:MAG TPA: DJ-1 family glyoxalase III [Methylophaga sp.]|nr:DJ-1 family glyoxalase III [Methylophaga sp.]
MSKVLIPLATGCEELEAVTLIDLLRRAQIDVVTASLTEDLAVTASRGVILLADTTLDTVLDDDFEMIVLPGGQPGANNLNADPRVHQLLKRMADQEKWLAAICAAPLVLATAGLLNGFQATAYPDVLDADKWPQISLQKDAVVIDGRRVTSRGPGTAMDFALTLIDLLVGSASRQQIAISLVRS